MTVLIIPGDDYVRQQVYDGIAKLHPELIPQIKAIDLEKAKDLGITISEAIGIVEHGDTPIAQSISPSELLKYLPKTVRRNRWEDRKSRSKYHS